MEVQVNNTNTGIIFSEPYTKEITEFIQEGKNNVELRIVGSMDNLFGPHHIEPDGAVDPWSWNSVKKRLTPKDYHLSEYGLLKVFSIYRINK